MHVLIGILALLFGRFSQKLIWKDFFAIVFAAVALHNFAYWLTYSHPSALYSAIDFAVDFAVLSVFVLAGRFSRRIGFLRNYGQFG